MNTACIFCRICAKEIPAAIVYEDADILAFKDIKPQAPTHILIIPKQHIAMVADITESQSLLMGKLIVAAQKIAKQCGIDASGFRLVFNNGSAAGQEVYHIHLHLLGGRALHWPPG